jgi:hypothetical protein
MTDYGSLYVRHYHQNIDCEYGDEPKQAEALLPELPAASILNPLEKKLFEGVDGRLAGKAIINVLVILVRFEPEFVGIAKEKQTAEQKNKDKSKGGLASWHF